MSEDGHARAPRAPHPPPANGDAPTGPVCRVCGEAIGVYEPLIAIERGRARRTSRAAEPTISTTPGEHRHLACHERRGRPASRDAREHVRTHARAHARENSLAE